MGVPKFFRWMTLKYPTVLSPSILFDGGADGNAPEFDHLLLDMNGIIHRCTHSDDSISAAMSLAEIMAKMEVYLDKFIAVVRPKKTIYFAVDGVAPRAKLNQQRSRRFRSTKERLEALASAEHLTPDSVFDTNAISPGTELMRDISQGLRAYIEDRIANHPLWTGLTIHYSGHEVPGEGEHKIIAYLRELRASSDYIANERYCINGQDADMIMLAMATHEPHFCVLREVTEFLGQKARRKAAVKEAKAGESGTKLHYIKINVLRDLIYKELVDDLPDIDKERVLDDFVFLTFLVGNDFLPHIPTLRIGDNAFDKIFDAYSNLMISEPGYIVEDGVIRDWCRLEDLFQLIGAQENAILQERDPLKQRGTDVYADAVRDAERRGLYDSDGLCLALQSLSTDPSQCDYRRRYYYAKFGILVDTTEGASRLRDIVRHYVEGIAWCLGYYSTGCISWQWFFPHHYGPLMQDVKDLLVINETLSFSLDEPFKPFQQLLGCLPPSSASLLPHSYRPLMLDAESPLSEYYPVDFETDLNGEKKEYMSVVLLPFIDAQRLLIAEEAFSCTKELTLEEQQRNTFGVPLVYFKEPSSGAVLTTELPLNLSPGVSFISALMPGTLEAIPGFDSSVVEFRGRGGGGGGRAGRGRRRNKSGDNSVAFFAPPLRLARVCKFYLKGKCSKGTECAFDHPAIELGPDILVAIREQLEFYFSEKNWIKDEFLMETYLQNDNVVPVEIVLGFAKMRKLLGDLPLERQIDLVITSLVGSTIIALTPDGLFLAPMFLAVDNGNQ